MDKNCHPYAQVTIIIIRIRIIPPKFLTNLPLLIMISKLFQVKLCIVNPKFKPKPKSNLHPLENTSV